TQDPYTPGPLFGHLVRAQVRTLLALYLRPRPYAPERLGLGGRVGPGTCAVGPCTVWTLPRSRYGLCPSVHCHRTSYPAVLLGLLLVLLGCLLLVRRVFLPLRSLSRSPLLPRR